MSLLIPGLVPVAAAQTPQTQQAESREDAEPEANDEDQPNEGSTGDEQIHQLLLPFVASADIPGAVAAIATAGEEPRIGSAGVRQNDQAAPLTIDDTMHLGSCTKAFTAALVGILIDEGKLTMESTIGEVLPELAGEIHSGYSAVTLRQLLEMRGGIPATLKWWNNRGETITERRNVVAVTGLQTEPQFEPGTQDHYTNLSYLMAGLMCSAVAEKTWEELIQERIFQPLELTTAGFGVPGEDREQPWGHRADQEGNVYPIRHDNSPLMGPAGTIHMSAADWAKFLLEFTDNPPKGILSESMREQLTTVSPGADRYACGWIVVQRQWAGGKAMMHNGSNTFWYALTWVAPANGKAYLIVMNSAPADIIERTDVVINSLIQLGNR